MTDVVITKASHFPIAVVVSYRNSWRGWPGHTDENGPKGRGAPTKRRKQTKRVEKLRNRDENERKGRKYSDTNTKLPVEKWSCFERSKKSYPSMSMMLLSILYTASLMSSNWQLKLLMMIPIVWERLLSRSLATWGEKRTEWGWYFGQVCLLCCTVIL